LLDTLKVAYRKDPALHGVHALEVILYQGIWAIWSYWVAHVLWRLHMPFFPLSSRRARGCSQGSRSTPGR
jgi:serine O-acetyltransferase